MLEGDLRLVLMEIPVYGFYAEERGRASGWRYGVFIHPANSSASLVGGSRRQLVGLVLESQTTPVPYSGLGGGWGNGEQTGPHNRGGAETQTLLHSEGLRMPVPVAGCPAWCLTVREVCPATVGVWHSRAPGGGGSGHGGVLDAAQCDVSPASGPEG